MDIAKVFPLVKIQGKNANPLSVVGLIPHTLVSELVVVTLDPVEVARDTVGLDCLHELEVLRSGWPDFRGLTGNWRGRKGRLNRIPCFWWNRLLIQGGMEAARPTTDLPVHVYVHQRADGGATLRFLEEGEFQGASPWRRDGSMLQRYDLTDGVIGKIAIGIAPLVRWKLQGKVAVLPREARLRRDVVVGPLLSVQEGTTTNVAECASSTLEVVAV